MIQRIQTIFLFLASAAMSAMYALPMAKSEEVGTSFFSDKIYTVLDTPILYILCGITAFIGLLTIFLYNNRPLQIKLSYVLIVLAFILPITAIALIYIPETFNSLAISQQMGIGLPVLTIIFGFLAARFIKKDEKLVKSMDRLR